MFSILVLFSLAMVSLTATFALVLGAFSWELMSPMYLGPAHDVQGVEVLVCVSCDIYVVLDGLGRSGRPSHPPVVFCLCRRNGSSPFRLCLPAAPPPRLLGKPDALHLPLVHPPFLQRGVAVWGSWRGSRIGFLEVSSLPFCRFSKGEGPHEPWLLWARAIQLLPLSRG